MGRAGQRALSVFYMIDMLQIICYKETVFRHSTKNSLFLGDVMKITIKMIAEKAGVSAGTVDRVLHNRPNVKPEVRERVEKVIQELDYQPNKAARALAYRDNYKQLAIVFPSWSGYFRRDIEHGIADAEENLSDFGVSVQPYIYDQRNHKQCLDILDALQRSHVNGIALCAENSVLIREKINDLHEQHIPVVTFNSDIADSKRICFVGQETLRSGRVAAEILSKYLRDGEETLVVLGNYEYSGHKARVDGFLQRFDEIGVPRERFHIIECYNEYTITFDKVYDALAANPNIRFIYMANRSVTACAEVLRRMGLAGKIRVVCHDVTDTICQLLREGVVDFTIEQDLYAQGYRPLMILGDMLMSRRIPERRYQYTALNIINAENVEYLK